jgi:hypothetical protein
MVARALVTLLLVICASATTLAAAPRYQTVAAYVGVPADILYAMAKAESGLRMDGQFAPWPWTLNVAGVAQRFDNRQAMFEGLMGALGSGEQRIDIGPMQVNWCWQFAAIGSPWRITDPVVNLKVAAQILKTHYARSGDWWEAVGRYHRPADGPKDRLIAERYRNRVRHFYEATDATDAADTAEAMNDPS